MKIPVLYTCCPTKEYMKIAEMLECHTAQQLLKPQEVSWTATLQVLEGSKIEITLHLDGEGVSEEETLTDLIDAEDVMATPGKEALVKKLKRFIKTEENLSEHIDLLEKIFEGSVRLEMVEMTVPDGDAIARFEVDIDVVPSFEPSFEITC